MHTRDWRFTMTKHPGGARFRLLDPRSGKPYGTVSRLGDRFHAEHDTTGPCGTHDSLEDAFQAIDAAG